MIKVMTPNGPIENDPILNTLKACPHCGYDGLNDEKLRFKISSRYDREKLEFKEYKFSHICPNGEYFYFYADTFDDVVKKWNNGEVKTLGKLDRYCEV